MAGPVQDLPEDINDEGNETPQKTPKKSRLPKQNPNWFPTTMTGVLDEATLSDPTSSDLASLDTAPPSVPPPEEIKEKFRQSIFETAQEINHHNSGVVTYRDLLHSRWDDLDETQKTNILTTIQSTMSEEQKELQQKMLEFKHYKDQKTFDLKIFVLKFGATIALLGLAGIMAAFIYVAITQGTLGDNNSMSGIITAIFHGIKIIFGM